MAIRFGATAYIQWLTYLETNKPESTLKKEEPENRSDIN